MYTSFKNIFPGLIVGATVRLLSCTVKNEWSEFDKVRNGKWYETETNGFLIGGVAVAQLCDLVQNGKITVNALSEKQASAEPWQMGHKIELTYSNYVDYVSKLAWTVGGGIGAVICDAHKIKISAADELGLIVLGGSLQWGIAQYLDFYGSTDNNQFEIDCHYVDGYGYTNNSHEASLTMI